MKKIVLISTFCDTGEKLGILRKNITTIKSYNMDVMVISPFHLESDIVELCDYFFLTKDNPVLDWPQKSMCAWIIKNYGGKEYKLVRTYPDYGFSGLSQVKQLSDIAMSLDYDQFHHIIYDTILDQNVIAGFLSDKTCTIYPSKREDIIWAVGLHYMIFDKGNLRNFISHITLENYLSSSGGDAFSWLHSLQDVIGYEIGEIPVSDEIYYYSDFDFFDHSPITGIKIFIAKNDSGFDPDIDTIKLFFYDTSAEIKLSIDSDTKEYTISEFLIIDLGFNKTNYKNVVIETDSISYDITNIIKDIKHSILEYD